jgi:glutamine amidotransferase
VLEPPSSLLVQSWAPRRQRHGTVNADGWGVGFYVPGRAGSAHWRSAPFSDGRWLPSHDGRADRAALPPAREAESTCDRALLAARVFVRGAGRLGATVREPRSTPPPGSTCSPPTAPACWLPPGATSFRS